MSDYLNYQGYTVYLPEGKMQLAPVSYETYVKLREKTDRPGYWFALPRKGEDNRYLHEDDVKDWCGAYGYEYDKFYAKILNRKYSTGLN